MKMRVQAQHLQPGNIVGSGERILSVQVGLRTHHGKCEVFTNERVATWGKYTEINIERPEKVVKNG